MNKLFLTGMVCLTMMTAKAETVSNAAFNATVYAVQSMSDNDSPAYMVNWATTANGITVDKSKVDFASHVTTLNIDASAISGTISSVSVYANSNASIVGNVTYNPTTKTVTTSKIGVSSIYRSDGASETVSESDVVTVEGSDKTCKVYLLPVALAGGVKVTVKTSDGNYYTQDFTDDIAAGATKTLTVTNTTAGQLWMATIPGSTYFSMLSTPGAHDAATSGVTSYTSASKCQGEDIATLLKNGVRCFDIRPGYYYTTTISADNLYIYHGQVSTNVKYTDAMATLVDFVKNNPTEAITITMVKENCKPTLDLLGSWTDRSSEMWTVINAIQETYKDYMKTLDHSYYTLDDFRGKICYINRTGTTVPYTTQITNWPDDGTVSDYSCVAGLHNASVQDKYNTNGSDKQTAIEEMLQQSSSCTTNKNMHFNFCSSANSPASYASATNPVITTYLNDNNISGSTGYLYADYIGSSSNGGVELLKAIINQNYKYVFKGLTQADKVADDYNMDLSQGSGVAWTKTGTWTDAYGDATTKTYVTENYSGWSSQEQTNFALTRTVSLPAGIYKLTGYGMYNGVVGTAKLVAKSGSTTIGSINIVAGTLDSSTSGSGGSDDLRKAANAFAKGVSLNTVYFVLTEPASVTIGFEGTHTDKQQWFVGGPMTLTKIDRIDASESTPVDVTSFINNPTVYNKTQSSCPTGWTCFARTAGNGNYTTGTGDTQIENWHGTPANAKFDYYQTLTLPAGKYTLATDMLYQNGGADEVGIYAYDVATGSRVTAAQNTIDATLHNVTLDFTTTGGQVNIGIINLKTMTGDWFAADNFTLKYYGPQAEKRSIASGKYGTICLPYAATATGATVYSAEVSGDVVKLSEVGASLEAGTPYIFKATSDNQTFADAGGMMLLSPSVSEPLTGVFVQTQVPVGKYVLQNLAGGQKFYVVASGSQPTLSAYKAYLTVPSSPAKSLSIGFADGETTGINAINALVNGSAKIYDLNGRQLQSLQKGINIVNGVKVIVK